jgi:hypothetical protein
VAYTEGCKFVAVSYTWAAGSDSCGMCRATGSDFLARLVEATELPVSIDKIYVPQGQHSLTNMALRDMASVYSSTEYVLIIEQDIDSGVSTLAYLRDGRGIHARGPFLKPLRPVRYLFSWLELLFTVAILILAVPLRSSIISGSSSLEATSKLGHSRSSLDGSAVMNLI